jgi:hypothetical protein
MVSLVLVAVLIPSESSCVKESANAAWEIGATALACANGKVATWTDCVVGHTKAGYDLAKNGADMATAC